MTRKTIALDIDEVLFPFLPVMNEWFNSNNKTLFKLEDYNSYILEEIWGGTKEDTAVLIGEFIKTELYREIKPIDNSQEGIELLYRKNDLIAISYRPKQSQQETEENIERYFPKTFRKVICLGNGHYPIAPIHKAEVCKQEGASMIIEDSLGTAIECTKVGMSAIVFDYPWNQNLGKEHENVKRIYNPHWKNLIKHLKQSK